MNTLTLEGTLRTELGKKASQTLRRNGMVLCNLYGNKNNVNFYAPYNSFLKLVYNPDFFKVQVNVDGKSYETLVKEIQFHPVSDRIMHIDFLELVPGKKIVAEVPLKLTGLAEGVKVGGKLIQKVRKLKIRTTPENLTGTLEVNVNNLGLGKSIFVRDIPVSDVEIVNSPKIPIASVEIPRALKSAQDEAAKAKTEKAK